MNAKNLLLKQTEYAFSGSPVLSLKASLKDLTQEEASWKLSDTTMTIEEILHHVASFEAGCCNQEFGRSGLECDETIGDIGRTIDSLDKAHEELMTCLQEFPEQELGRATKMELPFESVTDLLSVLVMHDISHAAQIRTIRRAYSER